MSNFDKANLIIGDLFNRGITARHIITEALDDAGLLAPDLPKPQTYGGREIEWSTIDGYVNVESDLITIFHDERAEDDTAEQLERLCVDPGEIIITSPESAKQMGHLLIAAADYAEQEQKQ